jgi:rod shape-determining protein MreC
MVSKKTAMVVGIAFLIAVNLMALSVSASRRYYFAGPANVAISFTGPFQEIAAHAIRFASDIWHHYFYLVTVAATNERLEKALRGATRYQNQCMELALSNQRLRNLLDFKRESPRPLLAAEVIGRDPSPWFKSVTIDKGLSEGVAPGAPVVMGGGVVGMVTDAGNHYARVLLIIDQNSAVDVLLQEERARGVSRGASVDRCRLDYVLRKYEVEVGDAVISSGLDGVFPKGLRVGVVEKVSKLNAGVFQTIYITPFVDFEKLEEVMVVMPPPKDLRDVGR